MAVSRRFAERLSEQEDRLEVEYDRLLRDSGNVLVESDDTRAQLMSHARLVLRDVTETLSRGEVPVESLLLAVDIGRNRADAKTHPRDSLRAAVMLYEALVTVAEDLVPSGPEGLRLLREFGLAANRSITERVGMAATSYSNVLLREIGLAHAEERHRIARELHDQVSHGLNIAHRHLELQGLYRDRDPERAEAAVQTAHEAVTATMHAIHQLVSGLRLGDSMTSLELGLADYVESLPAEGIEVSVVTNGDENWASAEVLHETFLMVREGLRNAIRHARATKITAQVDISPSELQAVVVDDGVGGDLVQGSGMSSMGERAALLNGAVRWESVGQGTRVEIRIPLARENVER